MLAPGFSLIARNSRRRACDPQATITAQERTKKPQSKQIGIPSAETSLAIRA
jgi:hypothetical protein